MSSSWLHLILLVGQAPGITGPNRHEQGEAQIPPHAPMDTEGSVLLSPARRIALGEKKGPQVAEAPGSLQAVLGKRKWFLPLRVKAGGVDRCTGAN